MHRKEPGKKREQQGYEWNQLQEHERDEKYQSYEEPDPHGELIMKANLRQRGGCRKHDWQRRRDGGFFHKTRIVILRLSAFVAESGIRR